MSQGGSLKVALLVHHPVKVAACATAKRQADRGEWAMPLMMALAQSSDWCRAGTKYVPKQLTVLTGCSMPITGQILSSCSPRQSQEGTSRLADLALICSN